MWKYNGLNQHQIELLEIKGINFKKWINCQPNGLIENKMDLLRIKYNIRNKVD
jgi:hypothetical protein